MFIHRPVASGRTNVLLASGEHIWVTLTVTSALQIRCFVRLARSNLAVPGNPCIQLEVSTVYWSSVVGDDMPPRIGASPANLNRL